MSAHPANFSQKTLGGSRTGLGEWLLQRLTALYISAFVVYLVMRFSVAPIVEFMEWQLWFASGAVRVSWGLFFASALVHAWIGLRSVYLDYVRPLWLRFTALTLTGTALLALALWTAQFLLEVSP
jgi:succinate dehydrogenase / fumarate reductase membrane anchor subunit